MVLVSLVTLNWVFVIVVLRSFERYKPVRPLTAAIQSRFAEGDVVAHYDVALPSMVYYLAGTSRSCSIGKKFLKLLQGDRKVFAVLSAGDYDEIVVTRALPKRVLESRRGQHCEDFPIALQQLQEFSRSNRISMCRPR